MGLVEGAKDSVRVENEGGNVRAESNFANDGNNSQISNPKPKYSTFKLCFEPQDFKLRG